MNYFPINPSTTFVFGIESGYFEAQTLLAVECLRKFGGRFADAPVLAITPRLGPSLTSHTLQRLDELNVIHIKRDMKHPDSWYCYMNKALAIMLAEEYAITEQIIWMDSDTLIVKEPELLWLEPEIDFAICSTDKNVGTGGPGDPNELYWLALCKHFCIDIDRLPWIETEFMRERVRFRLHSGIYAFRRGSGLGKAFVTACEQMLHSRLIFSKKLPFPGDDVALAFAVVLLDLRWRLLPLSYNYEMTPKSFMYKSKWNELHGTKILHYHKSMTDPSTCAWALNELSEQLPELHNWLVGKVPIDYKIGGFHRSITRRFLREWRDIQQKRVRATSKVIIQ